MKRRQWRAAVSAFIITMTVLGMIAGFLLADQRTAQMTFGAETQPLSVPNHIGDFEIDGEWKRLSAVLPVRFRAILWLEQVQFDTVSYWIGRCLS